MSRLDGAVLAVRQAVAAATNIPLDQIGADEDLITETSLDELECESLSLIVEEVFSVSIPEELWRSPLYRTPAALAEWLIRKSDAAGWETSRQRKHG